MGRHGVAGAIELGVACLRRRGRRARSQAPGRGWPAAFGLLACLFLAASAAAADRLRKNPFWEELGRRAAANCDDARMQAALAGAEQIDSADRLPERLRALQGRRVLLRDFEVSGIDLRGLDLANAYLGDLVLRDANLAGLNLDGAVLERVRILNSDLRHATLRQTRICNSDFTGSRLDKADLGIAELRETNLSQVSARKGRFEGAVLYAPTLSGADLSGANLQRAILFCDEATLGVDCPQQTAEADIANADLGQATLAGLELRINLSGSRLDGATIGAELLPAAAAARFETLEIAPSPLSEEPPAVFSRGEALALAAAWRGPAAASLAPWLACANATDSLAQAICWEPDVAALARLVSGASLPPLSAEQRAAWQRRLRECPKLADVAVCLRQGYIGQLFEQIAARRAPDNGPPLATGLYGPSASFPADGPADAQPDAPARLHRLLRRSLEFVTVRRAGATAIDLEAYAPGSIAHECALSARFVFEPARQLFVHRDAGAEVLVAFLPPYLLLHGGRGFCGEQARWSAVYVLRRPS